MYYDQAKETFKANICHAISDKCSKLTNENGMIRYNDGKSIIQYIQTGFMEYTHTVPEEIKMACHSALQCLAPSVTEKKKLIKTSITFSLELGGAVAIAIGIIKALGIGDGILEKIRKLWLGTNIWGIIIWIIIGIFLSFFSIYFYCKSDDAKDAVQFEKTLINGLERAINELWPEYGSALENVQFPYQDK